MELDLVVSDMEANDVKGLLTSTLSMDKLKYLKGLD
jgi:hypothetical protein